LQGLKETTLANSEATQPLLNAALIEMMEQIRKPSSAGERRLAHGGLVLEPNNIHETIENGSESNAMSAYESVPRLPHQAQKYTRLPTREAESAEDSSDSSSLDSNSDSSLTGSSQSCSDSGSGRFTGRGSN
jgi:hypothetical protein